MNGQGRMLYPNGDYYIGMFKNHTRDGYGTLHKGSATLTGLFKKG